MRNMIVTKALCLIQVAGIGLTASVLPIFGMIEPAKAQAAPTCLSVTRWTSIRPIRGSRVGIIRRHARVTNKCGKTQRFKVIWAFAPDSSCITLRDRRWVESRAVGRPPRFDGLRRC